MFRRFRTAQEVFSYPGFCAEIGPDEQTFDELLGDYRLPKRANAIKCARSQCHQPHWYGFVARTTSGKVVPIGNVCGQAQFGDAFGAARDAFKEEIDRQIREDESTRRIARTNEIRALATQLLSPGGRVSRFESAMRSLSTYCSKRTMSAIQERATRRDSKITVERALSKAEREALPDTGKRQPRFISEVVGHLEGLKAFNLPVPRDLLEHQLLSVAGRYDDTTPGYLASSALHYRQHIDFVSKLEDAISDAESRLDAGSRFFRTDNLRLLRFIADTPDEQAIISRLVWNGDTGEVAIVQSAAA